MILVAELCFGLNKNMMIRLSLGMMQLQILNNPLMQWLHWPSMLRILKVGRRSCYISKALQRRKLIQQQGLSKHSFERQFQNVHPKLNCSPGGSASQGFELNKRTYVEIRL